MNSEIIDRGGTRTSLSGGGQSSVGVSTACCPSTHDRAVGIPTICCGCTHGDLWGYPHFVVGGATMNCGATNSVLAGNRTVDRGGTHSLLWGGGAPTAHEGLKGRPSWLSRRRRSRDA